MLTKKLRLQNGNFLVIVSFIATAFVLFFSLFSVLAKNYILSQKSSEVTEQANYIAESVLERLPFEYNENKPLHAAKTILNKNESICNNFSFHFFDANTEQSVTDFGANCQNGDFTTTEIGNESTKVTKNASRMVKTVKDYLDRYDVFEYRLTRNEYLETLNTENFPKPAKLQIQWWNTKKDENPRIEFILASFQPLDDGKQSSNIQVHRIQPKKEEIIFEPTTGKNTFTITDFSKEVNTPLFCNENCDNFKEQEYILFVKSFQSPLSIEIQGFQNLDDTNETLQTSLVDIQTKLFDARKSKDAEEIQKQEELLFVKDFKIPSPFVFLSSTASFENEQDPLKTFTQTAKGQKELYRNFDSSFPYARYEIF